MLGPGGVHAGHGQEGVCVPGFWDCWGHLNRAWEPEPGKARGESGRFGLHHRHLSLLISLQLQLEKHKGEILGVVVVESGWGSILPTVILANMMNGGPAARSGKLSIGDQIMSINGTSLVGLPLATCQGIIKVRTRGPWLVLFSLLRNPPLTHEGTGADRPTQ